MKREAIVSVVVMVLAAGCWAGRTNEPRTDSKTNWLAHCESDATCGELACVCGVCTKACTHSPQCARDGEASARCVDPTIVGIASTCASDAATGAATGAVCLLECARDSQCHSGQRCLQGACVETRVLDKIGLADGPCSVSGACTSTLSCADQICVSVAVETPIDAGDFRDADLDAESVDAAHDADVITEPEPPAKLGEACNLQSGCVGSLACSLGMCREDPCVLASCELVALPDGHLTCSAASTTRTACSAGACPDGFLCHVDGTCIEAGACDSHGISTLPITLDADEVLMGVDEAFAYTRWQPQGTSYELRRRPLDGGAMQLLSKPGDLQIIEFSGSTARLYFEGTNLLFVGYDESHVSYHLGAQSRDGSTAVLDYGQVGGNGAEDADYLYLTQKDSEQAVVRVPKSKLADDSSWEVIHQEPTNENFVEGIEVNRDQLVIQTHDFPNSKLWLRVLDKSTLAEQKTFGIKDATLLHVTDKYALEAQSASIIRVDLQSGKQLQLDHGGPTNLFPVVVGNNVYRVDCDTTPSPVMNVRRIDIDTAQVTTLLSSIPACASHMVRSADGVFMQMARQIVWIKANND